MWGKKKKQEKEAKAAEDGVADGGFRLQGSHPRRSRSGLLNFIPILSFFTLFSFHFDLNSRNLIDQKQNSETLKDITLLKLKLHR